MDIPVVVAALGAVFLCLLVAVYGGLAFAIRGGFAGEAIKAAARRVFLEWFWTSVGDRWLTAGGAFALAAWLGGVGDAWALAAFFFLGGLAAVDGHGLGATVGDQGTTGPDRGGLTVVILNAVGLSRPTHWTEPAPRSWDLLYMTVRFAQFGLAAAIAFAIAGQWIAAAAALPALAVRGGWIAWGLGDRLDDAGVRPFGAASWRQGEFYSGALMCAAIYALAALG
ncbi:MAG: hypothetical protein AAF360_00050 [Pseudomonadota bacterium]